MERYLTFRISPGHNTRNIKTTIKSLPSTNVQHEYSMELNCTVEKRYGVPLIQMNDEWRMEKQRMTTKELIRYHTSIHTYFCTCVYASRIRNLEVDHTPFAEYGKNRKCHVQKNECRKTKNTSKQRNKFNEV